MVRKITLYSRGKCGIWREAAITPGLEANFGLGNTSTFYGRVSAVGAYTWGVDAVGSNVGSGDVYDWRIEDSYIGWRSGNIISSLDKDALDISIGRQKYQVGTGFLFWRASSNGGDRGAAWMTARKAADLAGIIRLKTGSFSSAVVYIAPDDNPDSNTRLSGVTLDYDMGKAGLIGGGFYNIFHSDIASRDGMSIFDLRADLKPFSKLPQLQLQGEFAYEDNGDTQNAIGWYGEAGYRFENFSWSPYLGYRYAFFEGDNPNTTRNEEFDPLCYGVSDWGTWFQGEILSVVLPNHNVESHTIRLQFQPDDALRMILLYFYFRLDDPQNLDSKVTDKDFAQEVDLIFDWSATNYLSFSGVAAVSIPEKGAKQYTAGDDNWWHFMLYAKLHF